MVITVQSSIDECGILSLVCSQYADFFYLAGTAVHECVENQYIHWISTALQHDMHIED